MIDALALGGAVLLLFCAVLGAREPAPPAVVRLGRLLAVAMLHAAFAIWMLVRPEPLAAPFYAALALASVPELFTGQRHGAVLVRVVSDLAAVAAACTIAQFWRPTHEEVRS